MPPWARARGEEWHGRRGRRKEPVHVRFEKPNEQNRSPNASREIQNSRRPSDDEETRICQAATIQAVASHAPAVRTNECRGPEPLGDSPPFPQSSAPAEPRSRRRADEPAEPRGESNSGHGGPAAEHEKMAIPPPADEPQSKYRE